MMMSVRRALLGALVVFSTRLACCNAYAHLPLRFTIEIQPEHSTATRRISVSSDPYHVLGVPPSASSQAIRQAYWRLAKRTHPDASREKACEDFMRVKEAYETLVDPEKRSAFDRRRMMGKSTELIFGVALFFVMDMAVPLVRDILLPTARQAVSLLNIEELTLVAKQMLQLLSKPEAGLIVLLRGVLQSRLAIAQGQQEPMTSAAMQQ